MIDCPRCGFSQPKDRYCANCGVDMDSYVPKPLPLWKRFLNNPFSYVAIMAAILIGLVIIIKSQPNSKFARNFAEIVPIVGKASPIAMKEQGVDAEEVNREIERRKQEQKLVESFHGSTATEEKKENNVEPAAPEKKVEAVVEAPKIPQSIDVKFVEIAQAAIGEMMNEATVLSDSSDMQSMVIKNKDDPSALNKYDPDLQSLSGARTEKLSGNEPTIIAFTYPSEDGQTEYGLTIQISLLEISAEKTSIDFESYINLPGNENSPPVSSNASGSYQFDNDKTLVISGILPRVKLSESELGNLSGPLRIYSSESFTSGEPEKPTEFLIYIQVN